MGEPVYSHTGQRYVIGYGADSYGIWDRQAPGEPAWRFPRTEQGWQEAWARYVRLEPHAAPIVAAVAAAATSPLPPPMRGPQTAYVPGPRQTNGFAIASLVFGIIGGWLLALIFGYVGKSQIDRSGGTQGGRGMAIAGITLGWVWLGILILLFMSAGLGFT